MATLQTERFVASDGARLWSIATGSGVPLVLFNGGPGCDDYLGPVAELIDDRCRVVRFEPRGCGRSDWDGKYDLATLLLDAEAIRQDHGFDRWIVAGHSNGPNLALAYALSHPQRVIGLVGLAGGKVVDDRHWSETYHARLKEVGEEHDKLFHADPEVNRQGNASWRAYCHRPTLFRDLAALTIPCVFINAGQDIRPNWPTQQLAELIAGARYIEIPDAAHHIWRTHPAELQRELRAALSHILERDAERGGARSPPDRQPPDRDGLRMEVSDSLPDAELETIRHGLSQHAAAAGAERDHRPLHVVLRSHDGGLVGALVGATIWGWLEVNLLWVAESERARGLGSRLLAAAEQEARRRACRHARLDTFTFQAPAFYQRRGYHPVATLPDFPPGHQRLFLTKKL